MVQKLVNATDIIGRLENGDLAHDLSGEIRAVIQALQEAAGDKHVAKGSVTLTLKFEQQGIKTEIDAEISSKTPKKTRPRSFFFTTEDGALSLEHPNQHDMFPREASRKQG